MRNPRLVLLSAFVLAFSVHARGETPTTKVEVTTSAPAPQPPQGDTVAASNANANANASATTTTNVPVEVKAPEAAKPSALAGAKNEESSTTTNIQNNNITLGQPSVITVQPANQLPAAPAAAPAVAYKGHDEDKDLTATDVLGVKKHEEEKEDRVQLTPMIGTSGYTGSWYSHVSNTYTFGLGLEFPLSHMVSLEAQGGTARYSVSYGNPMSPNMMPYAHYFNQHNLGGDLKIYLTKSWIRPYVGAGLMGLYYDGMSTGFGPNYGMGPMSSYSQWVGAGQGIVGADVPISKSVALGARGSWILPLFNRPATMDNGGVSMPGYEEAALMNTSMYQAMGTVSVAF